LLASFHTGYLKRISHQIVVMRAEHQSGQSRLQSTIDNHLVLTGQVLEALRAMGKPTAPSGLMILQQIKEVLSFLGALYKAWPIIRWAIALNTFGWLGKQAARLLGWL
jgi:hypothetical protein